MNLSRRAFVVGASAATTTLAPVAASAASRDKINSRVRSKLSEMYRDYPFSQRLADQAAGMLMIPRMTKGGFFFGGAYGEGSLLIKGAPVDYYSLAAGSYGLQFGVQQFASALFLMNTRALTEFRRRDGWTVGVDLEAVAIDQGEIAAIDTNTQQRAIYALNFSQKGLMLGASIEGAKYSRIVR